MHVCLIVPGPLATATEGHYYDRRMADGLRAAGHDVDVVELDGRLPDADQAAIYAARTVWAALPGDCAVLIDGLALPAFAGLPLRQVTGVVHHPASQGSGMAGEAAHRLHGTEAAMFGALPRIVATSAEMADQLAKDFGVPPGRIGVVIPGADDLPRCGGSAGPSCRILSVGALIPRKGHAVLLRALGLLFDLDWELTVAGSADRDRAHADGLAALVVELNIAERVRFVDAATEALWAGSDVFALVSHLEGYGLATAEALRRGLPVAVSNAGAAPSLVDPEAGVVCAPGDVEQLSKALRRMIFDRTLRRDMAEAAWKCGQSLPSWDEQAGRLVTFLAERRDG